MMKIISAILFSALFFVSMSIGLSSATPIDEYKSPNDPELKFVPTTISWSKSAL